MTGTSLTTVRESVSSIKAESGTGSKQRKQDEFAGIYTAYAGHLLTGERYDDAGVGPATARDAAESAYPSADIDDYPTLSEALIDVDGGSNDSVASLIDDLDELAELGGNEQQERLSEILGEYTEPSLVTLALLGDESFGLGTSQMRQIWFDGDRSERKRAEAICDGTVDFINRAQNDALPTGPQPFVPFEPMLAKSEKNASESFEGEKVAQLKIDGYRCLIHVRDGDVDAYSRNEKDITQSLPELQEIEWPSGSYIIDAEVIAEDGTYKSTSERVGTKPENLDETQGMNFACFDLVYKNGDITREPYRTRYKNLERLVEEQIPDPRMYLLEASSNIEAVKEHARRDDYEGVILKNLDAEYELATRSSYWVKQKNQAESVDVVAAEFVEGEGRLDGTLGKIGLQTADGVPVGSTGSGFTDEERDRIWRNRDEYRGEVLEVEGEAFADNIRFPIFQRWRTDDGEADTLERVESLLS